MGVDLSGLDVILALPLHVAPLLAEEATLPIVPLESVGEFSGILDIGALLGSVPVVSKIFLVASSGEEFAAGGGLEAPTRVGVLFAVPSATFGSRVEAVSLERE